MSNDNSVVKFCEVALDLEFLSKNQIDDCQEKQRVDEAIGVKKPIAAYFFEMGFLDKEKIGQILKVIERYESHSQQPLPPAPQPSISPLDVVANFAKSYTGPKSSNVWLAPDLPEAILSFHKNNYANLQPDEVPLFILNKAPFLGIKWGWTGMLITDRRLFYRVLRKSFFASLFPRIISGYVELSNIREFLIGATDKCFGNGYIGHEISLNSALIGYMRMGMNILPDDEAIATLVSLLNSFVKHKLLAIGK